MSEIEKKTLEELEEDQVYEYLIKECSSLLGKMEQTLKKKGLNHDKSKMSINSQYNDLIGDISQRNFLRDVDLDKEDPEKLREKLLNEKKILEDQFLDVNIDIQKKKNQLADFQEELNKTNKDIEEVDNQIHEKTGFIQFLEENIDSLKKK